MPAQIEPAELHWSCVHRRPFIYDRRGQWVTDSDGVRVFDIRGWGYLTGGAALAMSAEKAAEVQDAIAAEVVRILNKHWGDAIEGGA